MSKTGGVIFQGPFRDFGELNSAYAPLRNGVNFPENGFRDFAFDSVSGQWQTLTMWQLTMKTPADKDWMAVSTFPTVTEAARRIVELEGIPKNGLFLEFYVETYEFGTDDEALRVFHYTGKRALYGIKRSQPN